MSIEETIYTRIRRNYLAKRCGSLFLSTPWLVNSPIYKVIENKLITIQAKRFEKQPPRTLHLENTNHCNAACIMCPNQTMNRVKAFMSDDIYRRAISEASNFGIKTISIISIGEPFMDRKLVPRIQEAKRLGLDVVTSTNGSLLTPMVAEAILESGLDELDISFDGFTKETYEAIRIGLNFDQVLSNINEFFRIRRMRHKNKPRVMVRFVKLQQNYKEADHFLRYWGKRADDVIVGLSHNWIGGVDINFRSRFHSTNLRRVPCQQLWRELVVYHDGTVVACCQDYEGTLVLGNIKHQSIAEIWSGESMALLRQAHLSHNLSHFSTCAKCHLNSTWWSS